jgi:ABC-type Zn2+ transport system substrate-binding protein/surface adhesin
LATWGTRDAVDLGDICEKIWVMSDKYGELLKSLADSHEIYRRCLKDILAEEEALDKAKAQQKTLKDKLNTSEKKQKGNLDQLQTELQALDRNVADMTASQLGSKRRLLKDAFQTQFDALLELSSKVRFFMIKC